MNTIFGTIKTWSDWPRIARGIVEVIKPAAMAGEEIGFSFFLARTDAQNRLFHSCFRDLARDCLLNERKADPEDWKSVLKQAFYEATKNDPDYVNDWRRRKPRTIATLSGDGLVYVPIESKRFTKNLARAFITFIHATGDERGVRWSRTSLGREWAELAEAPE